MKDLEFALLMQHALLGTKGMIKVAEFLREEGEVCDIREMSEKSFNESFGVSKKTLAEKGRKIINLEEELRLCEKNKIRIVTFDNDSYPELLKNIQNPPIAFYTQGNGLSELGITLAIVGTRRPTYYGIETAKKISEELAACNITIISGLARGIDTCAHEGALRAKGKTVGVLGSGLLNPYPKENRRLIDRILENRGMVISELPLRANPLAHHFPLRNRIITGLARGVCVVEAAQNSGSLITANIALEEGREVYAIPGMIQSLTSRGTLKLIQEGAKLVSASADILVDLAPSLLKEVEIN